ncbi:hypothetical protein TCAL_16561 [Tigriopus californicus]|uniref:HMG box domain-containing protein n=1 Tax=Tigriopus californicus TaxID=6832 RepID=A0A553NE07_TIGCA|nr:high mobility group protein 20A-like [Tigriopus californicus]TRY63677.1 hypothetical protein TCAL_16561 [Tigriopus californicus]
MDAATSSKAEKIAKTNGDHNAASQVGDDSNKNRGWPKGKKRYLKAPGAPKQPLSGYVHFLNDRRESLRKEQPDISFADISKKLAGEWSTLGAEEKQRYHEKAEQDKERYNKEFSEYQGTEDYKKHLENIERKEKEAKEGGAPPKKKSKKAEKLAASKAAPPPVDDDSRDESNGLDLPIFTEEFLEFNKAREGELRQLKKQVGEMEEQNAVLGKHVETMKSAIGKLEMETNMQNQNSSLILSHVDALKSAVVQSLKGEVPRGEKEPVTMDNVDQFMRKLHKMLVDKSLPKSEALIGHVRGCFAQLNYPQTSISESLKTEL